LLGRNSAVALATGLLAAGLVGAACPASAAVSAPAGPGPGGKRVDDLPSRRVTSATDLHCVLRSNFKGRVIVPAGVRWEMRGDADCDLGTYRDRDEPLGSIPLNSDVQLVGERGALGSRPVLYTRYKNESYPIFQIKGNDVHVEGLHLAGPAGGNRSTRQAAVSALEVVEDPTPKGELGRRVLIADNEFDEWTGEGVAVRGTVDFLDPPQGYTGPRMHPADVGLVRVERNYFHHNARDGLGYGVSVGGSAYVTIEGNVFDFNRHAVTSSGHAFNGYVARFNYVLQGGFKYGDNGYWGQHFDVHGTATPEERAHGHHDGGRAGEEYDVSFNTVRGEQTYGGFAGIARKSRAAFELRGRPATRADFSANVLVHNSYGDAIRLVRGSDRSLNEGSSRSFNLYLAGNRYNADYSTELAAGDFDGDGQDDVFVANGTAWFFSRAGIRPWEYLHASNKRTGELGFADIDNDRVTDVLYRAPDGKLGYVKSGRGGLLPLTSSPVPMKDLRFGDFDGDGLTDIFRTRGGHWDVWYGRTRSWARAQDSTKPISELLFGDFDGVRGTDVVAVNRSGWGYSSGATRGWARLNGKLSSSFASAVAADFDGNGRSDIGLGDGQQWRYSRDGRAPLSTLRNGPTGLPYPPLKRLLLGRFGGGRRTMVVTFNLRAVPQFTGRRFVPGERLVIWRGLGTSGGFSTRSGQNMR
jgi:hypothetical protein